MMARNQQNSRSSRDQENAARALVVQPPRLPFPANDVADMGVSEGQWKALVDAVYPSAKTVDGVVLALRYCKSRNLDPFKRAVHVVPMWNSALGREVETVWPGINELRTTASRTNAWAGNDDCLFGPTLSRGFKDSQERGRSDNKYVERGECPAFEFPEWAQVTVYKIVGGQRVPFVGPKVRFVEAFSGEKGLRVPNSKWRSSPFQMLEKCAEAAALRRAFPEELANDYTAEEMEGKAFTGATIEATATVVADDGGAAKDARPTRESTRGWSDEVQVDLDYLQQSIDLTTNPDVLRKTKDRLIPVWRDKGIPDAAIKELELRFDTAIGRMEGDPGGDDAGTTDGTDQSAEDEETDEQETGGRD